MQFRIVLPVVACLILVGILSCLRVHRSESLESAEVVLPQPYLQVLAALGKKSSFESIVSAGGGALVERSWDEFKFELGKRPRLSSWGVHGRGHFRVRSQSGEFSGEMDLIQDVEADRQGIRVSSQLSRPCGFVKQYETKTSVTNGNSVVFSVENRMVYERRIPFWMAGEVDRKVKEHNRQKVEAVVEVVRSIVELHSPSR